MKKIFAVVTCLLVAAVTMFCGCSFKDGADGRDGKDGEDVSIRQIYEELKKDDENLTFEDFLKEYLSYNDEDVQAAKSLQSTINRSLMSGVTILTRFSYTSKSQSSLGWITDRTTYKVYTGSGAILWLDKEAGDAYVVTNCHVIYDDTADKIYSDDVRLYLYGQDVNGSNFTIDTKYNITGDDNYRIPAEVIGASVTYDIALLKVSGSKVLMRSDAVAATFSTQEDVFVGEQVYAVGNASGEGLSASDGIISKDCEDIQLSLSEKEYITDSDYVTYRVMRITAAINHGNSGGPLFNTKGEIIGIVNAKDDSADVDNMGYALPANNVRRLLSLMYDNYTENGFKGGINKAYLNIETVISDSYARFDEQKGLAVITDVVKVYRSTGGPSSGKLESGDILKTMKITSADGTVKEEINVTRRYHVTDLLLAVRKGDTVTFTVERGGKDTVVDIVFGSDNYFKYFI